MIGAKKIRLFLLLAFSIFHSPFLIQAQSIGFWNVENLFDTLDTPLHDDGEFTPHGANRWNTARYEQKIAHLARVLDDMSLPVVGLCEVEGENVLRDLCAASKSDYAYLWLPSGDGRGIDQALLYQGDRFFPEPPRMVASGFSRGFLYIKGMLDGRRVDLVVCHLPSMVNPRAVRSRVMGALARLVARLEADPEARVVVMGDMNALPDDAALSKMPLQMPLLTAARQGAGSYAWDGRWQLMDQIRVSRRLEVARAGIFIRPYLLQRSGARRGYPYRTFAGREYLGGYSDHLPVFVTLAPYAESTR